jgi:hypothetical protein
MAPRTLIVGLSVLATIAVAGCELPSQRERIGTLGTSGNEVFVNGQRVANGTPIYENDDVSTGPASSAIIDFSGGGFFPLDQNTDPVFKWELIAGVRCIIARVLSGQVYVDKAEFCLSTPAADVVSGSQINVRVTAQQSVFTLLQGRMTGTRPQTPPLVPGQEMTADVGQPTARIRTLSPAALAERVAWLGRYRFQGWCQDQNQVRPSFRNECDPRNFSFAPPQPAEPSNFELFPQRDFPFSRPPRRSPPRQQRPPSSPG